MEVKNNKHLISPFYTTEFTEYKSSVKDGGNFVHVYEIKEEKLDTFSTNFTISQNFTEFEHDDHSKTNYEKEETSKSDNSVIKDENDILHEEERSQCKFCDKSFSRIDTLRKHAARVHKDEPVTGQFFSNIYKNHSPNSHQKI